MKIEYVKPELEEIKLVLEGSFLDGNTDTKPKPGEDSDPVDGGDID